jgi:Cytochrome P460
MKTRGIITLGFALSLTVASAAAYLTMSANTADSAQQENVVDASGNIKVPTDYRTTYQYLGTWAVASDQDKGSKELHIVYASPGTVDAFRTSGHFPDGTVLVKEVYHTATGSMTTGTVSRTGALEGWFVMIRDSKDTHPGNKLWGNGWGWSWFNADNPAKTTSTDFSANCLPCHIPAKSTDWIYTQGYPVLHQ